MQCGLLGRTLGHSYSPQIHKLLGEYDYKLFEVEPEALECFFKNTCFTGINVTIPYKKAVIPFCAELSDTAKALGAVNTIYKRPDGSLIGHNTDYFGFSSMLSKTGICVSGKKVLVLGSGGASATVASVLRASGAVPIVISRNGDDNYNNLHKHLDASVIVNATPVGMYPNVEDSPLDLSAFTHLEGVLDLIYNPARTKLLQQAEQLGLITENGLWMLVAQAKESSEWFTQSKISDESIRKIYEILKMQMENVVLIGMPGSGKTTIGRILAEVLGMTFVDSDSEIAKLAGEPIPSIFRTKGENEFRKLEHQALSELGMQSGLVIATGGGCVTRAENYPVLHQNGTIIWIERDIDLLPTDGRPLSQQNSLSDMYSVRQPMYNAFADLTIRNHTTVEAAVASIISVLNRRHE